MGKLYQKAFAAGYDLFMASPEKSLHKNRNKLISSLKGKILDVGVGTGVNFQFYHPKASVIAVEPSKAMIKKALPKIPKTANIQILNYGINDSALENEIEESSLDAIICTLVLCTVPKPELALKNFKRWLKPSGKLIILEHIRSKKHFHGKMQDWANPIWKTVGEGCNLNRNTDELIKELGFKLQEEKYFKGGIQWYQGVFDA